MTDQLELGGLEGAPQPAEPLPPPDRLTAWRERIPSLIHFGTSTWTYPGWAGLVYSRRYPEQGASAPMLAEYARFPLFTTVGIDSSFYGPPTPRSLAAWSRALPAGFRCVSKVWDRITVHTVTGRREGQELAGQANPDFLNPDLFLRDVLEPYRTHFAEHMGPFVFEFQAMTGTRSPGPEEFPVQLDRFLAALPPEPRYAVEVRNLEFLTPAYFEVLRKHRVAHVFNSWTRMPPINVQLDLSGSITADFVVARALLRPGRSYAEAVELFKPYDRVKDPNPELRRDLVRLARNAASLRIPAYLIVNNRAEGSAPHTVAAVARMLAEE